MGTIDTGLLHLHNFMRWVILVLLLVSIYKAYTGWQGKKVFSPGDKKVWLFTMISAHITLLIGLYQVLFGRYGYTKLAEGTNIMKDKFYRFFLVEHPTGMIVGIILITLAHGMSKKAVPDETKYRKAFYYLLIALIVILAVVPWPFREVVGRPLMP
jgi:uncharacterized membrane protein